MLLFTDLPNRIRIYRWERVIRYRLSQIENMASEARKVSEDHLRELGVKEPGPLIDNFINNNFMIEPVSIYRANGYYKEAWPSLTSLEFI
jgi:hypothetical protein